MRLQICSRFNGMTQRSACMCDNAWWPLPSRATMNSATTRWDTTPPVTATPGRTHAVSSTAHRIRWPPALSSSPVAASRSSPNARSVVTTRSTSGRPPRMEWAERGFI